MNPLHRLLLPVALLIAAMTTGCEDTPGELESQRLQYEINHPPVISDAPPEEEEPRKPPIVVGPTFSMTPIKATFFPEQQMTTYAVEISNPNDEPLTFAWTGPNCGEHEPKVAQTGKFHGKLLMTWQHPHPECDNTTAHPTVRVAIVVAGASSVLLCHYNGAEDGTGPVCER